MYKDKNGSDIKFDISGGVVLASKRGNGVAFEKRLYDAVEIKDMGGENPQEELYPILGEIKGLFCVRRITKAKKKDSVVVDYYGIKKEKHIRFGNKYNQQVCLLLALSKADTNQLQTEYAFKILNDSERCHHPPKSSYKSKEEQVNQIIKNIRHNIGFHPKELYFYKKDLTIGFKVLKKD